MLMSLLDGEVTPSQVGLVLLTFTRESRQLQPNQTVHSGLNQFKFADVNVT